MIPPARQSERNHGAESTAGSAVGIASGFLREHRRLRLSVLEVVGSLVDKSLLHQEASPTNAPRFSLLETVRAYALEQLEASGELSAARRLHADWCLRFVDEFGHGSLTMLAELSWLPAVEAEHDNVLAALAWLEGSGDVVGMLRLASAVRPLWEVRGHHEEAIAQLERGLALGGHDGRVPIAVRMTALAGLGRHYMRQGKLDAAHARVQASLELAEVLGDREAMATMLYAIGGAETNREQYDRATPYLDQALAIYEQLDVPVGICGCHYFRGIGAYGQGRMADGVAEIEAAVHVRRTRGPVYNLSVLLNALGLLLSESGAVEPAMAALTESRTVWQLAAGTNREVQAEWLAGGGAPGTPAPQALVGRTALWRGGGAHRVGGRAIGGAAAKPVRPAGGRTPCGAWGRSVCARMVLGSGTERQGCVRGGVGAAVGFRLMGPRGCSPHESWRYSRSSLGGSPTA